MTFKKLTTQQMFKPHNNISQLLLKSKMLISLFSYSISGFVIKSFNILRMIWAEKANIEERPHQQSVQLPM